MGWMGSGLSASAAALALSSILAATSSAQTKDLHYNAPCTSMRQWVEWDPDQGDSVTQRTCDPGQQLRDLVWVILWKRAITGGAVAPTDSHRVQPCAPDSFRFQGPGHYYLTTRNDAGPGCASAAVTIMPSVLTDVELETRDPVLVATLYNVQGRSVGVFPGEVWYECVRKGLVMDGALLARGVTRGRLAAGVYFLRGTTRDRAVRVKRVVVVR